MKGLYFILLLILLLPAASTKAQDAHFSQYYASGLYLNPSLAGTEADLMAGVNYRNQWRSIVIPYTTSQVSVIAPFYSSKTKGSTHIGGIGGSVYNDRAGDGRFNTLGANINLAYNLYLASKHVVTFGVQGGFIQKSLTFDRLQWGEQFNPYIGFDATIPSSETNFSTSRLYPDIGAGFMYSFTSKKAPRSLNAYLGGSVYHLNMPNESLVPSIVSRLPMLMKIHGGVKVPLGERWSISPNVLAMMQNNMYHINSGLYVSYLLSPGSSGVRPSELIFGTWYRLQDSFIFSLGLGNKNFLLGFSYDFNNSSLRYNTQGRGAYEISLSIRKFKERSSVQRFHTPRI